MTRFVWIKIIIFIIFFNVILSVHLCPSLCECDISNGLRTLRCVKRNIVDINLKIPPKVQMYDLSYNAIQKIEDYSFTITEFRSILRFDLSNNMIFWIGLHAFAGLEQLQNLYLNNNRLQFLATDLFWYNKNLQILDLSGNKFLNLPSEPFLKHSNLKVLNLASSQISFIPKETFKNMPNLTSLDLSNNNMIDLKIETFLFLPKLHKLVLYGNMWHCNKEFHNFENWLKKNKIISDEQCFLQTNNNVLEKIVMSDLTTPEEKNRDLTELWDIEDTQTLINTTIIVEEKKNFINIFNERVPSVYSLIIGFELGVLIGIFGTYLYLKQPVKCFKFNFSRRNQYIRYRLTNNNDMRNRLVYDNLLHENFATPPVIRRQISRPHMIYNGNPLHREDPENINVTISDTNICPETPPPAYKDISNDTILGQA